MPRKTETSFIPPSPGETLRRYVIEGEHIRQHVLADAMGVSRLTVNQLINGKRTITADMALRLARVLRTSPEFWLNLQREVDLFEARKTLGNQLTKMPILRKALA